jgi:hypothetical protein
MVEVEYDGSSRKVVEGRWRCCQDGPLPYFIEPQFRT